MAEDKDDLLPDDADDLLPADDDDLVPADDDDLVPAEKDGEGSQQSVDDLLSQLSAETAGLVGAGDILDLGEEEAAGRPDGAKADRKPDADFSLAEDRRADQDAAEGEDQLLEPASKQRGFKASWEKIKSFSWAKENPKLAKGILAGGLAVVLLIIFGWQFGLFGAAEKPSRPKAPARQQRSPKKSPKESPQQAGQKPRQDEPLPPKTPLPGKNAAQKPGKPGREPKKPERSENVADWLKDDYFDARAEHDPRLVEAVEYLGSRFVGKPSAARMLANLLKPPAPADDAAAPPRPGARGRRGQPKTDKLIEAVVTALEVNRTDAARGILRQILAGALPTENDKAAVTATLKALSAHPCRENEDLLFDVLTAAGKLRPPGRGDVTADQLRQEAFALVRPIASERLRVNLARYLLQPTTPLAHWKELGEFLQEYYPDNLGAQFILYQGKRTPKDIQAKFEGYFTDYSSQAMVRVLGIPPESVGSSPMSRLRTPAYTRQRRGHAARGPTRMDTQVAHRIARNLWGARFCSFVEDQLDGVKSLEKEAQIVLLAGTIPVDSIRAKLFKTLQEQWSDGPGDLEPAGLAGKVVGDPGMLVLVKMLRRKYPKQEQTSGRKKTGAKRTVAKKSKGEKAMEQWMLTAEHLVLAWCKRFHVAALAQAEAARREGRDPKEGQPAVKVPLSLHPGAEVTAEYHLDWPKEAHTDLSGVNLGRLKIDYVRVEEENKLKKMIVAYRGPRDLHRTPNGVWMESVRSVPQRGARRSIDVLIGQVDPDPGRKPNEPEELIIEILSIEVKEP